MDDLQQAYGDTLKRQRARLKEAIQLCLCFKGEDTIQCMSNLSLRIALERALTNIERALVIFERDSGVGHPACLSFSRIIRTQGRRTPLP